VVTTKNFAADAVNGEIFDDKFDKRYWLRNWVNKRLRSKARSVCFIYEVEVKVRFY